MAATMPRWTMARLRTGSRNRCARRPKAAEPVPRPMRKARSMMVKEKIDEGLVRADGKYLYPIRHNIPVMLVDEAIPLSG